MVEDVNNGEQQSKIFRPWEAGANFSQKKVCNVSPNNASVLDSPNKAALLRSPNNQEMKTNTKQEITIDKRLKRTIHSRSVENSPKKQRYEVVLGSSCVFPNGFLDRLEAPQISDVSALPRNLVFTPDSRKIEPDPSNGAVKPITNECSAAESTKRKRPKDKMCQHCSNSFSNHAQLNAHLRGHFNVRNYICEFIIDQETEKKCDKKFVRKEELTRHQRTHTGEKPHVCRVCAKGFGRKDHLQKHEKTHEKSGLSQDFTYPGHPTGLVFQGRFCSAPSYGPIMAMPRDLVHQYPTSTPNLMVSFLKQPTSLGFLKPNSFYGLPLPIPTLNNFNSV